MKLKTVEIEGTTYAAVQDGKPVYVDGDKEIPFDAPAAKAKIKTQADELDGAGNAAAELAKWEKLGDLTEVRKAVGTLAALGEKGIDPENAAIRLAEAQAEAESLRETVADRDKSIKDLRGENFNLGIGSQIKGSKWVSENVVDALAEDRDTLVELYGRYIKPSDNGGGHVFLGKDGKPLKIDGNTPTVDEFLNHHVPKSLRRPSGADGSGDTGGLPPGSAGATPKHKGDFKNTAEKVEWMGANPGAFEALPIDPSTQPKERPASAPQ